MRHTFFFFNDTATTEIYTLSLHDALPISLLDILPQSRVHRQLGRLRPTRRPLSMPLCRRGSVLKIAAARRRVAPQLTRDRRRRSEEHTSELQSTPISRMPSSA